MPTDEKGLEEMNVVAMFNNIEDWFSSCTDHQAQTKLNLLFEFNLLNQFSCANIDLGTSAHPLIGSFCAQISK